MSPRRRGATVPARRAGGRLKGRHWVAIWLLGFLAVALVVIQRHGAALETARELSKLQKTRGALEVMRAHFASEIGRAQSRAVLVPLAQERLGLRLPQENEITILQDPRPR